MSWLIHPMSNDMPSDLKWTAKSMMVGRKNSQNKQKIRVTTNVENFRNNFCEFGHTSASQLQPLSRSPRKVGCITRHRKKQNSQTKFVRRYLRYLIRRIFFCVKWYFRLSTSQIAAATGNPKCQCDIWISRSVSCWQKGICEFVCW